MKRKKVNFNLLTQAINEKSIRYNTTLSLLINRELSTLDHCEENFISKSTLIRKMKKTVHLLSNYGLYISISDRMKLTGNESMIRIGEFIFLSLNYEDLSMFLFYSQAKDYLLQTNRIFHYLNLSLSEIEIEYLSIWVFINQHAIEEGHLLNDDPELSGFFENYKFVEKPSFLTDWKENDWKFFLLCLYTLDYISLENTVEIKTINPFAKEIEQWIDCFERHYFFMNKEQKRFIEEKLTKQLQSDSMIKLGTDIMPYLENLDINYLEKRYPIYFSYFEKFWRNFSEIEPIYAKHPSIKHASLLNCIYFVPLLTFMPEVSIFLCTNTSKAHLHLLKEKIDVHLKDRNIKFVENIHFADVIVTTINSLEAISEQQTIIQVRPSLPKNDLNRIKSTVKLRNKRPAKNIS
ncbi:helix-turn-helix domain-containing protein [Tetragenococcus koreensis]|uniref:helix-turn-helix domain-containing protein n=2 Tax=Tetragenococcus TaxID=51668 RepID=UPI001F3ED16F|nr:helix-turn-helix domain-containing protein [Tetragenococcus koreensis]MCF1620002.1 helix-turn-helix domain-containing protein [Tetragenococcus koreensis]MCF1657459.1 helix-turn-helix domain-containing protein [Tetragenococcus koreensis]